MNMSTYRQLEKIFLALVIIIFWSVYKMFELTEILKTVLLAMLIGVFGLLSYMLGRLDGSDEIQNEIRIFLQEFRKNTLHSLQGSGKTET